MDTEPKLEQDLLENFQAEMRQQAEAELAQNKTAHLQGIDFDQLTEEDRVMWQTIEENWKLGESQIKDYSNRVQQSGVLSRKAFSAYLGNLVLMKMAEEMRSKRQQSN